MRTLGQGGGIAWEDGVWVRWHIATSAMVLGLAADAAPSVKIDRVEVVVTDLRVDLSDGRTLSAGELVGAVLRPAAARRAL